MTSVRIAELKSRLSYFLKLVRRGRPVVVMERDTPIARIVPYEDASARIVIRKPDLGAPRLGDIPLPPPLKLKTDVLDLLLEERRPER